MNDIDSVIEVGDKVEYNSPTNNRWPPLWAYANIRGTLVFKEPLDHS